MNTNTAHPNDKIAILGAGSWGSTLAWLLANHNKQITLWSHNPQKIEDLRHRRQLEKPIPVKIPDTVVLTSNLEEAVSKASVIIFACDSQSMRSLSKATAPFLPKASTGYNQPALVCAAKGLDLTTGQRMSEVISQSIPDRSICALSGPNLAVEILQGMPTASVIGCTSAEVGSLVQRMINVTTFRVYTSTDLIGVELGGTLKNVIAIAAGCSDGLRLGANAKAALLTRGLAEMSRLAQVLGAKSTTLAGLSGMGDLIATCSSPLSRNYQLGWKFAEGKTLEVALTELGAVAEGVPTAEAVCKLAKQLGQELPIAEQVEAALKGQTTPKNAIMSFMSRPLANE